MSSAENHRKGDGEQPSRVIDSFIANLCKPAEVEEADSEGKRPFWDRNTLKAALGGILFLFAINLVFYYSMRIGDADNTASWELAQRDFLIEYREQRTRKALIDSATNAGKFEAARRTEASNAAVEPEPAAVAVDSAEPSAVEQGVEPEATAVAVKANPAEGPAPEPEIVPAPRPTAGPTAAPEAASASESVPVKVQIENLVKSWAQAWSFQNLDAYLSYYSEDFVSQGGAPFGPWAQLRRDRVSSPEWIHVSIEDLRTLVETDLAVAEFIQIYTASNYDDESRKTLIFRKEPGGWKILEETSRPLD